MTDHTFIADIRAEVSIPKDGILSRTVHSDERITVTAFGFDTGQELTEHTSTKAAIIEIVEGEATVTLGGEVHEARAGSWIAMPPGLTHALVARTPVVMLLTLLRGSGG